MAALKVFDMKWIWLTLSAHLFLNNLNMTAAYASPHPASGSSVLVSPDYGLFWSRHGFQLRAGKSGWSLVAQDNDEEPLIRYLSPISPTGSLAVRTEVLKSDLTLETYTRKWMKDYLSYGFDVLATQNIMQSGAKGLVVDLLHKKSEQQLRQILFLKNKRVVVLTCRDQHKKFQQTIAGCNEIAKSFQWSAVTDPKAF